MFWKTCLDHSLEILTLILGSGILGYLFSRFFGSSSKTDELKAEYDGQIRSLNDRIRNQDIDMKKYSGVQASWASEKLGLQAETENLQSKIQNLQSSYSGFISPSELTAIKSRFDLDLKGSVAKYEALANEKKAASNAIIELEAKLAASNNQVKVATALETKIRDLEGQLANANSYKATWDKEKADWAFKLKTESDAKLNEVNSLQATIHSLTDQATAHTNEVNAQLISIQSALEKSAKENQDLQHRINQLNDSNQAGMAKLNETTAKIHQLENDLSNAQKESLANQSIATDLDKSKSALTEAEKKSKEWESRWKEVSAESEHYKVAHGSISKEKDSLKQRIGQLESEVLGAKSQIESQAAVVSSLKQTEEAVKQSDSKQDELEFKISHYSNLLNDWESKSIQWKNIEDDLKNNLNSIQSDYNELNTSIAEWEKKNATLHQQLDSKETEITNVKTQLQAVQSKVQEYEKAGSNTSNQLLEADNRYKELTSKFNSVQLHLSDLQKNSASSTQKLVDAESKHKDLTNQINTLKLHIDESQKASSAHQRQLQEADARYKELSSQYNVISSQLSDSQKSSTDAANQLLDMEAYYKELTNKFDIVSTQLSEGQKASTETNTQLQDAENRYKDIFSKFNKVQLQLAEVQRAQSHASEVEKKSIEANNKKYQVEIIAFQKRITDLQNDFRNKEAILNERNNKQAEEFQNKSQKLKIEVDSLNAALKTAQAEPKVVVNPVSIPAKKVEAAKPIIKIEKTKPIAIGNPILVSAIVPTKKIEKTKPIRKVKKAIPIVKTVKAKPVVKIEKTKPIPNELGAKPVIAAIDWKSVSASFGKKVSSDDHKIIEGIGPQINGLLKKAKISKWSQLADTSVSNIRKILDNGGNKFSLADPGTWPQQARLAAQGKWQELKTLQEKLNAVKKKKATQKNMKSSAPKIKPIVIDLKKGQEVFGVKFIQNDLKIIEGIGPKIEQLLHKAAIKSWGQLAKTNLKTIQSILDKGGSKYSLANPKTWAKQSSLAAEGAWAKLKSFQEGLKGGIK